MRRGMIACLLGVTAVTLGACGDREPPPVFSGQTLTEAKAAVRGTGKILIVKATASWCGPCQQMDRTTWRDPAVEAWVANNGEAIELDIDRASGDAQALRITAVPTMIAFKDGEEFDRLMGYRDAPQLVAWMEAVKRGERAGLAGSGARAPGR